MTFTVARCHWYWMLLATALGMPDCTDYPEPPIVEDPESVESVSLKGCRNKDDYQEVYMDLMESFLSSVVRVKRARLKKKRWFKEYNRYFGPSVQRRGGFEGIKPGVVAHFIDSVEDRPLDEGDAEALQSLTSMSIHWTARGRLWLVQSCEVACGLWVCIFMNLVVTLGCSSRNFQHSVGFQ